MRKYVSLCTVCCVWYQKTSLSIRCQQSNSFGIERFAESSIILSNGHIKNPNPLQG